MKKLSFLLALLPMFAFAAERSAMEAAALAAEFMNQQVNAPARRASVGASAMQLSHTRQKIDSDSPAFYVFNATSDGFVVVSADDRTEDVLMYSDEGKLDVENANPNLKFWLGRLQRQISAANDENTFTTTEKKARKATTVTAISPLLVNDKGKEITWNQTAPYWNQCPMDGSLRSYTGCVATAAAQIMYKWRYPEKGTGSHSYTTTTKSISVSQNFSTVTFDWANMLPAYGSVSSTAAQQNAVALLMRCCGVACEMDYTNEGSGSYTYAMGNGLVNYFGYKAQKHIMMGYYYSEFPNVERSLTVAQFTTYFNADLEAGRPILMSGVDGDGGHEFVCDGRDASGKFHINWGWEGSGNCYCLLSALKPNNDSGYDFSSDLDAIIGLEPAAVDTGEIAEDGIVFNYESITDTTQTKSNVSVVLAKGSGQNSPAWNTSSSHLRVYAKNTITVTGKNVIKVELTFTKTGSAYADLTASEEKLVSGGTSTGTTDEKTDTWTGKTNKVVFTLGASGQRAVKKIVVFLESGQTDTTSINLTNETVRLVDMVANNGIYQFYGNSDDNQYVCYVAMQNVSSVVGKVTASNLYANYTALYQINGTDTTQITYDAFLGGEVTLNSKTYLAKFNFQVGKEVYALSFKYANPEFDPTRVDTISGIADLNFNYWSEFESYGYKLWITEAWGSNYIYQGFFLGDNTVVTDTTKLAGTYTQDNMYEQSIYDANTLDLAFEVYQSSITFKRNVDGTYTITGTLLCYGNQTFILNLTTPQIGPADAFTLTLKSSNVNYGYVIGSGNYAYNTEVPIAAVCTQSGYSFKNWSDGITTAGRNVTVTENITLTAYFDIFKADTVVVHDTTLVPVEIHDTTYVPVHDTTYVPVEIHDTTYVSMLEVNSLNPTMGSVLVQILAVPNDGYVFTNWTDADTSNPRTIELTDEPQSFTAVFAPQTPSSVRKVTGDDTSDVSKMIKDNQLYILREGKTYNAVGNKMK